MLVDPDGPRRITALCFDGPSRYHDTTISEEVAEGLCEALFHPHSALPLKSLTFFEGERGYVSDIADLRESFFLFCIDS